MAGEILRALLTTDCKVRRTKTYTVTLQAPFGTASDATITEVMKFTSGTFFLWTGIAARSYFLDGYFTDIDGQLPLISFERQRDTKRLQLLPMNCGSIASVTLLHNVDNSTGEYMLFEGDEYLNVRMIPNQTIAAESGFKTTIALNGIEFIK